jgi:presenilin-like A22 family membrane protease
MHQDCKNRKKPGTLKEFLKSGSFLKALLGLVIGGLAGFLYFYFVGCRSGACAITSNPVSSIITGSILGFIIASPDIRCISESASSNDPEKE